MYQGEFSDGFFEGSGEYSSSVGEVKKIKGNFRRSQLNCENACIQFANGDIYEGPTKNGYMHGSKGKYTYTDGTVYQGAFYHNEMMGECEILYPADRPV